MFKSLPGFREFLPADCDLRTAIFRTWRETARLHAFTEYDGPILEPLDLYIEKSGPEIVGQLFAFADQGGRQVALRPEMTPTLARIVGSQAQALPKPVRWFSIGEQFRFERPQKGRQRAFYQFNVDLLGIPGPGADVEVIACAINALRAFGLGPNEVRLRLSDRQLWIELLQHLGVAPDQRPAVLSIVDRIERTPPEKSLHALLDVVGDFAGTLFEQIQSVRGIQGRDEMQRHFNSLCSDPDGAGRIRSRLSDWDELLSGLDAAGLRDFVQIDFGIVRGLAYYTGFVFEIFEASGSGRALAGGGRYDDLVSKLGGAPTPAVGMAMGDVTLIDLLSEKDSLPAPSDRLGVFIVSDRAPAVREATIRLAARLRQAGVSAAYSLKSAAMGKQFKEASQSAARMVVVIGENELAAQQVQVRSGEGGSSRVIPLDDAATTLAGILRESDQTLPPA